MTIVSQGSQDDSGDDDQTQIQLLKSRTLADRVVAAEGLATDPSFVSEADGRADRHAAPRGRAVGEEQNRDPGGRRQEQSCVSGK